MPIFEFQCNSCKQEFEKLVFAGDEPDITCPECKSRDITKKMSAVSFMGKSMGTCAADAPKGFS
jgi:putative FmdB family regulatory protein